MQYATRALSTRDQAFVAKLRQSKDRRYTRLADRLDPQDTKAKPAPKTKAHTGSEQEPKPDHEKPAQPHPTPAQEPKPAPQPQQQPEQPAAQPPKQEPGGHSVGGMSTEDLKSDPSSVQKPQPKGR